MTPSVLPSAPDLSLIDAEIADFEQQVQTLRKIPTGPGTAPVIDRVIASTAEILERDPLNLLAVSVRANALLARGELSRATRYLEVLNGVDPSPANTDRLELVRGLVAETDPTWIPWTPPSAAFEPRHGRVLNVLKESLPFYNRGYTIRSHANLMAQRAAGYDPVVVTELGFPREDGHELIPTTSTVDEIEHHHLDLGSAYRRADVPRDEYLSDWAWQASLIAERLRPEIVHAGSGHHGYDTALVGLALAQRFGLPFVYEVRSSLEQTWTGELAYAEHGERFERRMRQEERCMQEADVVACICETLRDDLIGRGIDPEKIHVLPNGVDPAAFTPRAKPESLRLRLGLPDVFTVGYISNLGYREGFEFLVRATQHLVQQGREIHSLIVGDGPRRDSLEQLVEACGLADHVTFTGSVPHDDVADHYALLDLFVVPRRHDRASRLITPLKPYEAMAMEIPIIVADQPALLEIVADGRGFSFKSEDAHDLARQIGVVTDDSQARKDAVNAAAFWIREERTWSHNAGRLDAMYRAASLGR